MIIKGTFILMILCQIAFLSRVLYDLIKYYIPVHKDHPIKQITEFRIVIVSTLLVICFLLFYVIGWSLKW
jgi:hypothetical protein